MYVVYDSVYIQLEVTAFASLRYYCHLLALFGVANSFGVVDILCASCAPCSLAFQTHAHTQIYMYISIYVYTHTVASNCFNILRNLSLAAPPKLNLRHFTITCSMVSAFS